MAGTLTVDTIQSDSSYASTLNVASKINFTSGMQIGGQDTTFGGIRNRVINGDMRIDQRNAGASVTAANQYSLDRWSVFNSQSSKFTFQQNAGSVTPPAGFTNYLGITSSSAYSITSGDYFGVYQRIEGYNVADLGWGTANASTVTLSFWVRSSLTGTFGGAIRNDGSNRGYPFTYTINSANTWEKQTITIPGDTTGTWLTTNGVGISVQFSIGTGSTYSFTAGAWGAHSSAISSTGATSVVGTNGATFYITGVQLEKGSAASAFEYRQYGTELALCQRYYKQYIDGSCPAFTRIAIGENVTTTRTDPVIVYGVNMRSAPTLSLSSISHFGLYNQGNSLTCSELRIDIASPTSINFICNPSSGSFNLGGATQLFNNTTSARLGLSAEL